MLKVRITKEGLVFLAGALVIVIIALAYMNNLAFLFAFSLLSISLLSVIQVRAQIRALELRTFRQQTAFAGQPIRLEIELINRDQREQVVFSAEVTALAHSEKFVGKRSPLHLIPKEGSGAFALDLAPLPRGRYALHSIQLSSQYPLGIFEANRELATNTGVFVYPRLAGSRELPIGRTGSIGEGEEGRGGGDDFSGHRQTQPGESDRRVDWKVYARRGDKLSKEFHGGGEQHLYLRFQAIEFGGTEERLSQLALWVQLAHEQNLAWGLEIPGQVLPADRGLQHYERSMRLLALYQESA